MDTKSFTLNQLIDIALCTPHIGMVNFKVLRVVLKVIVKELDIHDICARVLVKDLQEPANLMQLEKAKKLAKQFYPPKVDKRSKQWSPKEFEKDNIIKESKVISINERPEEVLSEDLTSEMSAYDFVDAVNPTSTPMELEDEEVNVNEDNMPFLVENESSATPPVVTVKTSKHSLSESPHFEEADFEDESFPIEAQHINGYASEDTVIVHNESLDESSHVENIFLDTKSEKSMGRKLQRRPSFDRASGISETRCSGNKWMIANMWKTMNFSRRIDAVETGMEKVVCVLDNHVRTLDQQRKDFERKRRDDDRLTEAIEENVDNLIDSVNDINTRTDAFMRVDDFKAHKNNLDVKFNGMEEEIQHVAKLTRKLDEVVDGDKKLSDVYHVVESLDERVKFLEENSGIQPMEDTGHYDLATLSRMFDEFMEKVKPVVDRLEKDVDSEDVDAIDPTHTAEQLMNLRLHMKQLSADSVKLVEKVDEMMIDMKKQTETIDMLVEAKENGIQPEEKQEFYEIQRRFKIVEKDCEQLHLLSEIETTIDTLKSGKAEKVEVEDALARKPEFDDMLNKVDRNIYETVIQDITDNLQDITHRVDVQEERLLKSMQSLTTELYNKVDKSEIEGITENIHNRLKMLAAKLKQLQYLVECDVPMPAGTKKSIATCISCNRPMRKLADMVVKSTPANVTSRSKVHLKVPNDASSQQKYAIPATECDHIGRNTGGAFTISTSHIKTASFPQVSAMHEENWKEMALEGIDHCIYRGKIEKLPPMPN